MEGEGAVSDPNCSSARLPAGPREAFGSGVRSAGGFEGAVGGFGRCQRLLCALTFLPLPPLAFALLSGPLLTLEPPHHCPQGGEEVREQGRERDSWGCSTANTTAAAQCPGGWTYSAREGLRTNAVTQWDLICDSSWKVPVEEICFTFGCVFGFLLLGFSADRQGRRASCLLSLTLAILFGTLVAVAPSLPVFTLVRFFQGASVAGVLLCLYLIRLELCDPSHRLLVTMVSGLFVVGGRFVLLGLAIGCRDWRVFQVVITAPLGLFLIYCCPQVLLESPRWLLSVGRVSEAKRVLGMILEKNGGEQDREPLELADSFNEVESSLPGNFETGQEALRKLLKCRNIWKNILILGFTAFIGHGIQHCYRTFRHYVLGSSSGFYLMYLLSAGTGGLACLFLCMTVDRCGRRAVLLLAMTLTGLASLILLGLTAYLNDATILVLCSLGLFSSQSVGTLSIFFCSELIPTVVRGLGLGLILGLSWMGELSWPILELHRHRGYFLHHVLYASLALLGCLCILLLPESKRKPLPDTLHQGEIYRRPSLTPRHRDNVPLLAAPNPAV